MTVYVLYDDRFEAPDFAWDITGAARLGGIVRRRRRLGDIMAAAVAEAGLPPMVWWTGTPAGGDALPVMPNPDDLLLIIPSWAYPDGGIEAMVGLLRMVRHALEPIVIPAAAQSEEGLYLVPASLAVEMTRDTGRKSLEALCRKAKIVPQVVEGKWRFLDLRDHSAFMKLITSNFDTRHFNSIAYEDDFTIVKQSRDAAKLRAEFEFHAFVPDRVRHYFVRPFDFREADGEASYRMERLLFPDVATQWIHGGMDLPTFRTLMDRLEGFLSQRGTREVGSDDGLRIADQMYLQKVRDRMAQLRALPAAQPVLVLLAASLPGGLEAAEARFEALYARERSRFRTRHLAFTHGDLCFSNILYDRKTALVRFIDPRGARDEAAMYGHPLYDLAKLSHSVMGHYDFINSGLYDVRVGDALALEVVLDRVDGLAPYHALFRQKVMAGGWDFRAVRIAEASLFLSMLPLHIDLPRKVLALALRAVAILDEVDHMV